MYVWSNTVRHVSNKIIKVSLFYDRGSIFICTWETICKKQLATYPRLYNIFIERDFSLGWKTFAIKFIMTNRVSPLCPCFWLSSLERRHSTERHSVPPQSVNWLKYNLDEQTIDTIVYRLIGRVCDILYFISGPFHHIHYQIWPV